MKKVPRKFLTCLHAYIKSLYLIALLKVIKFSAYIKPTQSLHKVYIPKIIIIMQKECRYNVGFMQALCRLNPSQIRLYSYLRYGFIHLCMQACRQKQKFQKKQNTKVRIIVIILLHHKRSPPQGPLYGGASMGSKM